MDHDDLSTALDETQEIVETHELGLILIRIIMVTCMLVTMTALTLCHHHDAPVPTVVSGKRG